MTTQFSENLLNDHPRVTLEDLRPYAVIRGDPRSNSGWGEPYLFATPPTPPADRSSLSALHRGYIATFRLHPDGQLELLSYDYLLPIEVADPGPKWRTQQVHELLTDDFWLMMKPKFSAPRTYVPFRAGRIVEDRAEWFVEEERPRTQWTSDVRARCPFCKRLRPPGPATRCFKCRRDWSDPNHVRRLPRDLDEH